MGAGLLESLRSLSLALKERGENRVVGSRLSASLDDRYQRLAWAVVLANLPAGALGYIFEKSIDQHFSGIPTIAAFLGIFGLLLGLAERRARASAEIGQLGPGRILAIGVFQAFALLPGASRTGSAITGGLLVGLTRAEAAHFSFLLGIPITLAACLLKFDPRSLASPELALGALVSGLSGWLCIGAMMRFLRRNTYFPFAVYRVLVSLILLIWMVWHR